MNRGRVRHLKIPNSNSILGLRPQNFHANGWTQTIQRVLEKEWQEAKCKQRQGSVRTKSVIEFIYFRRHQGIHYSNSVFPSFCSSEFKAIFLFTRVLKWSGQISFLFHLHSPFGWQPMFVTVVKWSLRCPCYFPTTIYLFLYCVIII